jgi:hypothetical protein
MKRRNKGKKNIVCTHPKHTLKPFTHAPNSELGTTNSNFEFLNKSLSLFSTFN